MPPEFFGQNICGACEGDGADLDLSKPIVRPFPACRFCGGSGLKSTTPPPAAALPGEHADG